MSLGYQTGRLHETADRRWRSSVRWLRGLASVLMLLAIVSSAATAADRPKNFCECPEHPPVPDEASVSTGGPYRLFAFNDAYQLPQLRLWCYTRSVWARAVHESGRFEWVTSTNRAVLVGSIKEDANPCGTFHNHYEAAAPPTVDFSQLVHGPRLQNERDIRLYYAQGDEFNPTWPERLKRRVASLFGFIQYPVRPIERAVAVRVSSRVLGDKPPFSIEYRIESLTQTTDISLYRQNRGPSFARTLPWLYWEAAESVQYLAEIQRAAPNGELEGQMAVSFTLRSVPAVGASVGRLMILAPGALPPAPTARSGQGVLLSGMAGGFRIVPLASTPPAPPGTPAPPSTPPPSTPAPPGTLQSPSDLGVK